MCRVVQPRFGAKMKAMRTLDFVAASKIWMWFIVIEMITEKQ